MGLYKSIPASAEKENNRGDGKALHPYISKTAHIFYCKLQSCNVGLLFPTRSEPLQKQADGSEEEGEEEEKEEDKGLRGAVWKYRLLICGQPILGPQGVRQAPPPDEQGLI